MKRNLILTSALVASLTLVGCTKEEVTTPAPEDTVSVEESVNTESEDTTTEDATEEVVEDAVEETVVAGLPEVQQAILTEDLLQVASNTMDAKEFYILSEVADKIEEGFVSQAMMNVKFRDIVVVKTSDVETIKATLEDYLASDALRSFKDGYGGEDNIEAISNAIINSKDNYVYLIATPNAADIEAKLLEALK